MDKLPRTESHKLVIIYDGDVPVFLAFADKDQEKRILDILMEKRRQLAQ